ncbi:MAG: C40 family peptidase [Bacteroidales bacterium]|nr:C40 family peptidase [Bacteroidales bacterium]
MSYKTIIAIAAFVMLGNLLWGQEESSYRAPWNRNAWTGEDILIPPLRNKVREANSQPDTADLILQEAKKHLGKPYRYGAKGPKAFDCAGFARYVYLQFGIELPGGSRPQYAKGRRITNPKKLQRGDLVFWQGREANGHVGHTGIVADVDTNTGRFRFIHAATSSGVIFSYSNEPYYAQRFVGGCRLIGDRSKPEEPIPPKKRKRH